MHRKKKASYRSLSIKLTYLIVRLSGTRDNRCLLPSYKDIIYNPGLELCSYAGISSGVFCVSGLGGLNLKVYLGSMDKVEAS
jgi:hypothetical protein